MSDIENPGRIIGIAAAVIFGGMVLILAIIKITEPSIEHEPYAVSNKALVENPAGRYEAAERSKRDIAAASQLRQRLPHKWKADVQVKVGLFQDGHAVVVGDTWAYKVVGQHVCSGSGLAFALLSKKPPKDNPYVCPEAGFSELRAAATRAYRWGDIP